MRKESAYGVDLMDNLMSTLRAEKTINSVINDYEAQAKGLWKFFIKVDP